MMREANKQGNDCLLVGALIDVRLDEAESREVVVPSKGIDQSP
jgi:hypothetical protein